jgi:hypothetical protein
MPAADLIRHNTHTLTTAENDDLAKGFAAPFVLLQDELLKSLQDEHLLLIAVARAEAKARALDRKIDGCVDDLERACLAIDDDKSHDPYAQVFSKKSPEEIKEPLLGEEITDVAAFLPLLNGSVHASLQAIGAALTPLLAAAVPVMTELRDANAALLAFYETGGRYQLVLRMNSARNLAYGQLGQLVHDHPELSLGKGYPDTFYLHDTRRRRKDTPASINQEIADLKKRITNLEIRRDKLVAVIEAEKQATSKKRSLTRAEEIAKAEKDQAEAAAKLAALKAEQEAEEKKP